MQGTRLLFGLRVDFSPLISGTQKPIFWFLLAFTIGNLIFRGLIIPLTSEEIDFRAFYDGAMTIRNELPLYENLKEFFQKKVIYYEGVMPYAYPPFFAILMLPLTLLSPGMAALLWNLLKFPILLLGFLSCLAAMKNNYRVEEFVLLVFMFFNFSPVFVDIMVGQSSLIIFLMFSLSWLCYKRSNYLLTGLFLASATLIKIFPISFLLLFIFKKKWKFLMAFSSSLLFLLGISVLFTGWEPYVEYFRIVRGQRILDSFHDNQSFLGFYSKLLTHTVWTKGIINSPFLVKILTIMSILSISLIIFKKFKITTNHNTIMTDIEYSIMIVFILLVAPLSTTPYLALLLIPLCNMLLIFINEDFRFNLSFWSFLFSYVLLSSWSPLALNKFLNMKAFGILSSGMLILFFSVQFFAILLLFLALISKYDKIQRLNHKSIYYKNA